MCTCSVCELIGLHISNSYVTAYYFVFHSSIDKNLWTVAIYPAELFTHCANNKISRYVCFDKWTSWHRNVITHFCIYVQDYMILNGGNGMARVSAGKDSLWRLPGVKVLRVRHVKGRCGRVQTCRLALSAAAFWVLSRTHWLFLLSIWGTPLYECIFLIPLQTGDYC